MTPYDNSVIMNYRKIRGEDMKKTCLRNVFCLVVAVLVISLAGCAVGIHKRSPRDVETIKTLSQQLEELRRTKSALERQLEEEISKGEVSISMGERGIVVTVVAEVLFDSGKAKIRGTGENVLDKVASVVKPMAEDLAIEGHTDNVPIKFSPWKSNWELSTQRALNVLHYFEDVKGINPQRLSATGYGPYKPVASNDTPDGRQMNRRVEIIILPSNLERVPASPAPASDGYDEFIK